MENRYSIDELSYELRSRIKREIIDPLTVMERVPKGNTDAFRLANKIFEDFKKVSDRIWEDIRKRSSLLLKEEENEKN